jgi:hypothetical protein
VGSKLLANRVWTWEDEADAACQLAANVAEDPPCARGWHGRLPSIQIASVVLVVNKSRYSTVRRFTLKTILEEANDDELY